MFVHQMRQAQIDTAQVAGFDDLLDKLPDGFRRTLLPARQFIANTLGLPAAASTQQQPSSPSRSPSGDDVVKAELIATDTHVFAVLVNRIRRVQRAEASGRQSIVTNSWLNIHSFGPQLESEDLRTLCNFLNNELSIELRPNYYESARLDELIAEGRTPPDMPSNEEIMASHVLSDKPARTLAVAVKQSSGLLVADLDRQLPPQERERTKQIQTALEKAAIVAPETVVICKKTGAQVARVADPTALEEFAQRGLKCACGSSITDEKIDTALSISDLGRSLLDSSHWLTVILIELLVELGVPLRRILIDQVSGGDELDCIADVSGEIVLFELKDKEFNLGNAYSFGAKIGTIGPEFPVIVTTEHVGNDAKTHFSKPRRASWRSQSWEPDSPEEPTVTYIEGIGNLKVGLMTLISQINQNDATGVLQRVLPSGTISASAVIDSLHSRLVEPDLVEKPSVTPAPSRGRTSRSRPK